MSREALKLALEALDQSATTYFDKRDAAITAIKAALVTKDVSLPEQEPMVTKGEKGLTLHVGWDDLPAGTKLYTSPPQREWVGLTHNELIEIYNRKKDWDTTNSWEYEQAIEAKLKEKNT